MSTEPRPFDQSSQKGESAVSADQPRQKLTSREYDILSALNEGLTNKAIAQRLNIKTNTVKTHLGKLFDKLGVSSRLELVMFARHHNVLESSELESGELEPSELDGLGLSLTNKQRDLILRGLNGLLREEDVEPARRLADIIALKREEIAASYKKTVA
jgi:DNA-binding CsgD family transcriptional regulator